MRACGRYQEEVTQAKAQMEAVAQQAAAEGNDAMNSQLAAMQEQLEKMEADKRYARSQTRSRPSTRVRWLPARAYAGCQHARTLAASTLVCSRRNRNRVHACAISCAISFTRVVCRWFRAIHRAAEEAVAAQEAKEAKKHAAELEEEERAREADEARMKAELAARPRMWGKLRADLKEKRARNLAARMLKVVGGEELQESVARPLSHTRCPPVPLPRRFVHALISPSACVHCLCAPGLSPSAAEAAALSTCHTRVRVSSSLASIRSSADATARREMTSRSTRQ